MEELRNVLTKPLSPTFRAFMSSYKIEPTKQGAGDGVIPVLGCFIVFGLRQCRRFDRADKKSIRTKVTVPISNHNKSESWRTTAITIAPENRHCMQPPVEAVAVLRNSLATHRLLEKQS
jgi:hypothetical protein